MVGFGHPFSQSILDNLTTTIVMVSLMKNCGPTDDRLFFAGIIVIAANAGGAWTPIGDVTTTMLWIGGQITTVPDHEGLVHSVHASTCWCRWLLRPCCWATGR